MSNDEKVNYYLNRFIEIVKEINNRDEVPHLNLDRKSIKEAIKKLVEANIDYLLTDSYIFYVLMANSIPNVIKTLLSLLDENERIYHMYYYFKFASSRNDGYISKRMTGYEKDLFVEYFDMIPIFDDRANDYKDSKLLYNILCIITGYVFSMSDSIDNFRKYIDPYLNDTENILDKLLLQDICTLKWDCFTYVYDFDARKLISFIKSNLENERKDIR
jgi:hypothetical protein